jgi:polynucleotide 5'-hydroxyl-kinase GRC3/NOL9
MNNNQNINHHSSISLLGISFPLCSIPPYEIDVGVAFDLTGPGSEDVMSEEVGRVLNGTLVGFMQLDHHLHQRKEDKIAGIPYIQARPPPSPSES